MINDYPFRRATGVKLIYKSLIVPRSIGLILRDIESWHIRCCQLCVFLLIIGADKRLPRQIRMPRSFHLRAESGESGVQPSFQ